MRAIVEVESPSYLLLRSQELLHESLVADGRYESNEAIKKAIALLALHLVKDDLLNGHTPPGTRKTSSGKKVPMQIGGG